MRVARRMKGSRHLDQFGGVGPVARLRERSLVWQIREYILEQIESGQLRRGQRVPAERELCQRFGVSRMTVRQAMDRLAWEGVLERRRGSGTYVAPPKIRLGLQQLTSFSEDMRRRGLRPGSRILLATVGEADAEAAEALGLAIDRRVTHLRRLRLADQRPLALEYVQVPLRVFPDLVDCIQAAVRAGEAESLSLYALFERVGIRPARALQSIEASVAAREQASLLGVREGSPLLVLTRLTWADDGTPVEFVRSCYRGDAYRYETVLQRLRDGGEA